MDFYADAVTLLEALARALYVPDFFAGLALEKRKEKTPERIREAAIVPVRITRLWPPIRAEPGSGRQGQGIIKQQKIKEKG